MATGDPANPNCAGTAAVPQAAPGFLCLYEGPSVNYSGPTFFTSGGASGASATGLSSAFRRPPRASSRSSAAGPSLRPVRSPRPLRSPTPLRAGMVTRCCPEEMPSTRATARARRLTSRHGRHQEPPGWSRGLPLASTLGAWPGHRRTSSHLRWWCRSRYASRTPPGTPRPVPCRAPQVRRLRRPMSRGRSSRPTTTVCRSGHC